MLPACQPRKPPLAQGSSGLLLVALGLLAARGAARQTEITAPAGILQVMEKSRLVYNLGAPAPLARPVEELECGRRDTHQRLVAAADGKELVVWEPSPDASPHFEKAEEAFGQKRYAEAADAYRQGLALDPDYGPGWLFSGDVPYFQGDYEKALIAFRKALELDPSLPQAHRFAGDALARLGRHAEAEESYVQALAWDPAYKEALDALEGLGKVAGFAVYRPRFEPPRGAIGESVEGSVPIVIDPEKGAEWLAYLACKAVWRHEAEFRQSKLGGDPAAPYAWTLREEVECVANYLLAHQAMAESAARGEGKRKRSKAPAPDREIAPLPDTARHLAAVAEASLLEAFVAFAVVGQRCPATASRFPAELHEAVTSYLRRFVIQRPAP